jgi:hypothetical protein
MQILKIEVLINIKGTDQITLVSDLPNTFPMIQDQGNMRMDIDLQNGTAIQYMKDNFNSPLFPATAIVIDGKTGTKTVVVIQEH